MIEPIPFVDLVTQQARIRPGLDAALAAVLDHGAYVSGPEVADLEGQLASWGGTAHAVGCASGTDALLLALLALGVGPGDQVLVPAFTFAATAEVVALLGAIPVFVDVEAATFNLDPAAVAAVVEGLSETGERPPVGLIAVDLFGLPADYDALRAALAPIRGWIVADAAQSFGARVGDRPVGSLGDMTCTSFFPAKPLGCYGDGGAVLVDDPMLEEALRSLRAHGQGSDRYEHVRVGITGRLDTMQAAVLLQKLTIFAEELVARERVASRYREALTGVVIVPSVPEGTRSAWAQYTVRVPERDAVAAQLQQAGVPTGVYYPRPLSEQPAYARFPTPLGVPEAERCAAEVLSLPMHPYLDAPTQDRVIEEVRRAVAG